MSRLREPHIKCAGCGEIYPARFIRCHECRTTTATSRAYWQRHASDPDRVCGLRFIAGAAIMLWVLLIAGCTALFG